MTKKLTKLRPKAARTHNQVCQLKTDNYDADGFWILHGINTISLAEQRSGKPAKQMLTLPKKEFDKLVSWYLREQKLATVSNGER